MIPKIKILIATEDGTCQIFEEETIKPLLEKYIGSLPGSAQKEKARGNCGSGKNRDGLRQLYSCRHRQSCGRALDKRPRH